ncbi:MAG: molybdate transport system permease protein [Paraglaciecola sp.]|jgi:molybdate transport system permease protein
MIDSPIWQAVWLTTKLATLSTLLLFVLALPLAWWLSQTRCYLRPVVDAVITLPLILPPTVLGFYLLVLFSPKHPVGGLWFSIFDSPLVFSFYGLLIASAVYSLPFVVQPIRDAFRKIDKDLLDVSRTMGASKGQIFRYVILPLSKQGITTGCILGFAHTIGEFGVVLLIGGNIPGETRVLSIALYDLIETMQMELANQVAAGLLGFSFVVLLLVSYLQRR